MGGNDVCALVRNDHEDLDRALHAMIDLGTAHDELGNLLEVFRLALAIHTAAETRIFDVLLAAMPQSEPLALLAVQADEAHVAQRLAADRLQHVRLGSVHWYEHALELRIHVLDHAGRAEHARWTLEDVVPTELRRSLAREYAIERMRVLMSTSPLRTANRRSALGRRSPQP